MKKKEAICFNSKCRKEAILTTFRVENWKWYCERCWKFIWLILKQKIWK